VISLDTHITGFDARSWHRLVTLVAPGLSSRAPHEFDARAAEEGGTLLVLYHGERILRAVHTHRGVVAAGAWPGRDDLGALAQAHGARFVLAAEAGAVEELYERIGARVRLDDDLATTVLLALGAARELEDEGQLHLWPRLVDQRIPLPTATVLKRTFDFVLPDGRAALVALFDGDAIDTAVLAIRRGATLERVLGPEVLREVVGPLGGDFRRDYRVIRPAVERAFGPLAFGVFAETATVHALLRDERAGVWAEAIAARDVIMDPMPAWLAMAAGAGVVRAAAARSKGLMAGLGILGALNPTVRRIREVAEAVSGLDVERVLGFNPFRVLAEILRRSSPGDRGDQRTE
jgi:hypothetical protein